MAESNVAYAQPLFHEWSGIRSAPGLAPWRRCTCGAAAEQDHEADFHMRSVRHGTSGPDGDDAFLYHDVGDPRPDNPGRLVGSMTFDRPVAATFVP